MVKISGGAGVELVLEEEGSIEGDDHFTHLLFPTYYLLVGVTLTGAVVAWNLTEARRCGDVAPPTGATGGEECVTAVHCPEPQPNATDAASKDRYVFLGLESGRVIVVQVLPLCRASGYMVEPHDVAARAPEELLAPGVSGGGLGAVTSIASSLESEELALFGHQHGGIVLWDWIRRKRLALRGLAPDGRGVGSERDGEVTCLAFHPDGGAFVAGFAAGCYAVFSNSSAHDSAQPPRRWICEVGDDGSCPREGPTIVRTVISSVQWVAVRVSGDQKAWGLLVAGGVEMEEGEEPDGVSLLVPSAARVVGSASAQTLKGGGRTRSKDKDRALSSSSSSALASLETAVFVPFAIGQERLSHVHAVVMGGTGGSGQSDGRELVTNSSESSDGVALSDQQDHRADREKRLGMSEVAAGQEEPPEESVVVLGLVTWNEEVRAVDGRLRFRRASSVQACPIQTSPFAALLQLAPGRIGGHLSGFAPVTAVASTPLLSSSTILDFATGLGAARNAEFGSAQLSKLLRGGGLKWADGVPARARDEALGTSEMLIVGHSDGRVTLWECCGPAPRQDGVSISSGRVQTLEIPSGAAFLGALNVSEFKGDVDEDGGVPVTALDAWVERDHVAEAERNACWVAVGFASGEASVFILSSRMDTNGDAQETDCTGVGRGEINPVGLTPLAARPVEVSEVQLSESAMGDTSEREGPWKKFTRGRVGREAFAHASEGDAEVEDLELEAAIAKARADARAIEESGELNEVGECALVKKVGAGEREQDGGTEEEQTYKKEEAPETEKRGEEDGREDESTILRQELSEAMVDEGAWGTASGPPPPQPVVDSSPKSENHEEEKQEGKSKIESVTRRASLVQLALRLHSHPVRCVALSFDTVGSALTLIVADAEGVVSVTDVSTGSASLLPMRAPRVRPCLPSIAIGPLPRALLRDSVAQTSQRGRQLGAAGALFVLLDGWLNVFDLASRDPVDVAQVPGFARNNCGGSGGGVDRDGVDTTATRTAVGAPRDGPERTWLFCIDDRGLPLGPYASEPLSLFDPNPPHVGVGEADLESNVVEGTADAENDDLGSAAARTIWVTPPPSSTALDSHHEHELQAMSDAPTPRSFLLAVRGDVAVVMATEEGQGSALPFSRRSPVDGPDFAAFKGRSGAELVVKARLELPAAEGRVITPRVDGAGVCMVPAGGGGGGRKAGSRGCLVATDTTGFVTALLLPSLSPVFRDRLPVPSRGGSFQPGATGMSQKSVCNLVGELMVQGAAGVSSDTRQCVNACSIIRGLYNCSLSPI